eukprot:IDg18622t1
MPINTPIEGWSIRADSGFRGTMILPEKDRAAYRLSQLLRLRKNCCCNFGLSYEEYDSAP